MINHTFNILKHNGFKKYFKNTTWLFFEKVLRMFVGLFVGIRVARFLGPDQYGLLNYVQSFVGLFTAIASLGLDGIVVRELVKDETKENELLGTAFLLKILGSLTVILIILIAIKFTSNDIYTNVLIYIVSLTVLFNSFNVIDLYFQSKVLSKYVVYTNIITIILVSSAKIMLILLNAPLITFALIIPIEGLLVALGFVSFYIKKNTLQKVKKIRFNKYIAKSYLKDSMPLIFSTMMITIYMRIDQVMLKEMIGNEAVGFYSAAIRIPSTLFIIPSVIVGSLFPSIINAKNSSNELYFFRLNKIYMFLLWFSLFISSIIFIFSDDLISFLYGDKYHISGKILSILIWNFVFVSLSSIHGKWLTLEGLLKYSMIYSSLSMLTNIIANYFFIKYFGIRGAAYATLLSQFIPYIFIVFKSELRIHLSLILKSIIIFKGIK